MKRCFHSLGSPVRTAVYIRLLRAGYVRFRLLRCRCSPWLTLAIASFNLLFTSGAHRTREKVRCMSAITRINLVAVCEFLNELLW